MPSQSLRIGVLNVQLPIDDTAVTVPGLSAVTPTLAAITPDSIFSNDINNPILSTDSYAVICGLVAQDTTQPGYTVTQCSISSATVTPGASQVLLVSIPLASLPANYNEAVCMAVFLKINSTSLYQLQGFGYIDTTATTFTYVIDVKPIRTAPSFSAASLQSTTSDASGVNILGSRVGFGTLYETLTPTTGDTTQNFPVVSVSVSPNTGADYNIRTTVSEGFSFQLLINDLKSFIRAQGGNYVSYTTGGVSYRQGHMAMNTAQAKIRGNKPIILNFPPDVSGFSEVKLLIGNLTFNQQELNAAWSKSAVTPINFVFQPAALDNLINSNHTSISYLKLA